MSGIILNTKEGADILGVYRGLTPFSDFGHQHVWKLLVGIVTAVCLLIPLAAKAATTVTVDFEDVATGDCAIHGTSLTSQGVDFTPGGGSSFFVCNPGVLQNNTTPALIEANGAADTLMMLATSDVFSLLSFDAGGRTVSFDPTTLDPSRGSSSIEVTGHKQAGGTVVEVFNFVGTDFDTFTLPASFFGLNAVSFKPLGFSTSPEAMLDNIVLDLIPEPSTCTLAYFALLGVVWRRRKRALGA